MTPSAGRRKSLQSLGSRAQAIEDFAAAQPRFMMFSPFKPARQAWDMCLNWWILVDFDPRTHVVGDWGEDETWKDMRCAFWKILFEVRAWNWSEVTSCMVSRANRVEADEGRDASFRRNVWSIIGFYHWFSWVSLALSYANNYNYSNVTTV